MAGKTEEILANRMEEVNGLIDSAYTQMSSAQNLLSDPTLEDNDIARYENMYQTAQKTYVTLMTLLMQMTKNYDEAVKVDTRRNKTTTANSPQTQTLMQKLKTKESKK